MFHEDLQQAFTNTISNRYLISPTFRLIWHLGYMFRLYAISVMDIMHVKIVGIGFIHETIKRVRLTFFNKRVSSG